MKSQLQELISKVFTDEKTKAEFILDPNRVISRFNLTREEKKAVLKTHSRMGIITSNSAQLEAVIDKTIDWMAPVP